MKNLYKVDFEHVDVLIIDESGSEWIRHCIPSCYSVGVLKIRGVVPYFRKMSFYLFLFKRVVKLGIKYKALISAIIDESKPRVIITFLDNDRLIGELGEIFPEKMVIAVQNGMRNSGPYDCVKNWNSAYRYPLFFGFGDFEHELMISKGVRLKKYYSAGSLKMGLFLSKYSQKSDELNKYKDVCFISQYRRSWQLSDSVADCLYSKMGNDIFINAVSWAERKQYKLSVAMRFGRNEKDYDHELRYYQNYIDCKNVIFHANKLKQMDSYQVGFDSQAIVAIFTSLSYELFGCGKKVLFCGCANHDFTKTWGLERNFKRMPECVLLNDLTQKSFNTKMDALLRMDNEEYLSLTEDARSYYMNCNKPYAHELISERINDFCER